MKEFKTIDEQIGILRARGMAVGPDAGTVLLRENYYSVVNGYKDPFLDREAMQSSAGDVYLAGTEFGWMHALFLFDRRLRQLTFSYLIQAEAALKTATVYAFCEKHQGASDYLDRSAFCKAEDMLVPRSFKGDKAAQHRNNMATLMRILNGKLAPRKAMRPFTAHYLDAYGEVPLWVLANDLAFGNMAHFYQLMRRGEQNAVCKILFETTLRAPGSRRITPHDVLRAYDVLVHFRNLCAHDERLYCAERGGDTYATVLEVIGTALPGEAVSAMKDDARALIDGFEGELHGVAGESLKARLGLRG